MIFWLPLAVILVFAVVAVLNYTPDAPMTPSDYVTDEEIQQEWDRLRER